MMYRAIAGLFVGLMFVQGSYGIECYVCSSLTDTDCTELADPVPSTITKQSDCTFCQKTDATVETVRTVVRQCLPTGTEGCDKVAEIETCGCKTELCNGKEQMTSSSVLLTLSFISLFIIGKIF